MEQNTAYVILYGTDNTGGMANAWKTDATAWMTALNSWAGANTERQDLCPALTYADRAWLTDNVFAKGDGTINPEYAFWRAMTKGSFRNSIASSMNPTVTGRHRHQPVRQGVYGAGLRTEAYRRRHGLVFAEHR